MRREIKYKAYHEEQKQMYWFDVMWGNYSQGGGYIGMVEFGKQRDSDSSFNGNQTLVDPSNCILLQYWKDDHEGVAMYEGDLIEFHYFYGSLGAGLGFVEAEHTLKGILSLGELGWQIEAIEGEHWAGYTGFEDGEGKSTIMDLTMMNESGIHEESFKSTGTNIHQNPELLTK